MSGASRSQTHSWPSPGGVGGMATILGVLLVSWVMIQPGTQARPEKIRPDVAHYSDEYVTTDGVSDLKAERNYEEVYNNYEYFEAWYDAQKRIVRFIAYKQGQVDWEERYLYREGGRPYAKEVMGADGSKKMVELD